LVLLESIWNHDNAYLTPLYGDKAGEGGAVKHILKSIDRCLKASIAAQHAGYFFFFYFGKFIFS